MNSEEAKDLLDNLIGMVEDNQHNDYDEALKLAIRSLKAWEEVLQELEEVEEDAMELILKDDLYVGKARGLAMAIDIIKSKLEGVKE